MRTCAQVSHHPFMVILILRRRLHAYSLADVPRNCQMEWSYVEISTYFYLVIRLLLSRSSWSSSTESHQYPFTPVVKDHQQLVWQHLYSGIHPVETFSLKVVQWYWLTVELSALTSLIRWDLRTEWPFMRPWSNRLFQSRRQESPLFWIRDAQYLQQPIHFSEDTMISSTHPNKLTSKHLSFRDLTQFSLCVISDKMELTRL